MNLDQQYKGDGACGDGQHVWQQVGPESFVCLNCAAHWNLNADLAYWHACTGTPIPEQHPHAWDKGTPRRAVIWPTV